MHSPDITMIPADGRCERVWLTRFTTTHLRTPGAAKALCGSGPRRTETWRVIASGRMPAPVSLPACRVCELARRVAAAVAEAQQPDRTAGVLTRMPWRGYMAPIAECARCEQVRPLQGRGLCGPCMRTAREDGTLEQYGWLRADRLAEFAQLREGGLSVPEASARAGVSERTGWRYAHAITAAAGGTGQAAA